MVPIKNLESPMSPLNRSPMSSKVYFYNRYDNNTEKDIFSVKPPNNSGINILLIYRKILIVK
jgi:hypothetical protein